MGKLSETECGTRFKTAQKAAESHGGQLLAKKYAGVDAKYKWRCASGHKWLATYDCVVRRGQWCGKCSGHIPDRNERYKEAIKIAKHRRGKCVSEEYVNSNVSMRWRCAEGHEWKASFSNISRGQWCPYCAGNTVDARERLESAKMYAMNQHGECLTNTYSGNKAPMRWRCSNGHEWLAAYNTVVNRRAWCARCRGTDRDPVEQLERAKNVALYKGGRCLSDKYANNNASLHWRCGRGHEWEAAFYSVVQAGSWCPNCSAGLNERLARHALEQLFDLPFKKARPIWLINPETGRQMELDGLNEPRRPPQTPPPVAGSNSPTCGGGTVGLYWTGARLATRAAASFRRQLLPSNFSKCPWCIRRSSSGVTTTVSPSSRAQSSNGRFEVTMVEAFS